MSTNLFAKVAQATSQLGLPFPEHWWPPSVDREVLDEINSRAQDRS